MYYGLLKKKAGDFMLSWDKMKFSVGHPKLDEQHKTIIGLINQLSVDYHSDFGADLYIFTMKELKHYIEWHLRYEEKLMKTVGYPDLENHTKGHLGFIKKVEELTVGLNEIPPTMKEDIIDFLNDWFNNHILIEDMKLKPYVEKL
jgi:hemerythrin